MQPLKRLETRALGSLSFLAPSSATAAGSQSSCSRVESRARRQTVSRCVIGHESGQKLLRQQPCGQGPDIRAPSIRDERCGAPYCVQLSMACVHALATAKLSQLHHRIPVASTASSVRLIDAGFARASTCKGQMLQSGHDEPFRDLGKAGAGGSRHSQARRRFTCQRKYGRCSEALMAGPPY
jgi:hypothetical protein